MPIRKEGVHGGSASESDAGMTRDSQTGMSSGASTGSVFAPPYGNRVTDAAVQAKDYMSDKAWQVGDKLQDLRAIDYTQMVERAKEHARRNPGRALLISATAGFVIGFLLRGSRRK